MTILMVFQHHERIFNIHINSQKLQNNTKIKMNKLEICNMWQSGNSETLNLISALIVVI